MATALQELIVWYIMKQFIRPPDVNEVTMQKEILTPLKVPPATLDQASTWLEEMQHRLGLYQNEAKRASKNHCSICQ